MLADRIMRLMEDEGLRKRMGMNAYHNSKHSRRNELCNVGLICSIS